MKDKVYTTRQAGGFCGVDLTTVINWVKQGKLKAYKTAGGHRRIKQEDLIEFMEQYDIPIQPELRSESGMKILIVENDPNTTVTINKALKRLSQNYKVMTAVDGFETGNKLAIFKPGMVILDLNLPGVDGYKIIKEIKNSIASIKIIVITAYEDKGSNSRALSAGADSCLSKPLRVNDFFNTVIRFIE